ncbi:MAG: HU family DNA-binding protein [Blastocatellia bacterium]
MIKRDLIEQLAIKLGIPWSQAERYLNTFIKIIYDELRKNQEVMISGFGTFSVSHRESRIGVNPRPPHERITIPKLNTPKFVAGEGFKRAIRPNR